MVLRSTFHGDSYRPLGGMFLFLSFREGRNLQLLPLTSSRQSQWECFPTLPLFQPWLGYRSLLGVNPLTPYLAEMAVVVEPIGLLVGMASVVEAEAEANVLDVEDTCIEGVLWMLMMLLLSMSSLLRKPH